MTCPSDRLTSIDLLSERERGQAGGRDSKRLAQPNLEVGGVGPTNGATNGAFERPLGAQQTKSVTGAGCLRSMIAQLWRGVFVLVPVRCVDRLEDTAQRPRSRAQAAAASRRPAPFDAGISRE